VPAILSSCTKTIDNTVPVTTGKCYIKLFDFTYASPVYSTLFISGNKTTSLFTPFIDTAYNPVISGVTDVKIEGFGTGTVYYSGEVNFTARNYYTGVLYNQADKLPAIGFVYDELSLPASPGTSKVRILYTISQGVSNTPANMGIANATDSLFSYNRTDVDFLRVLPLAGFSQVHSGTFNLYVNGNIITNNLLLAPGKLYTIVVVRAGDQRFIYALFVNK